MSEPRLFVGGPRDGAIFSVEKKVHVLAVPNFPPIPFDVQSGPVHPDNFEVVEYRRKLFHMEIFAVEDLPADTLMQRFVGGYLERANQPSKMEWLMNRIHSPEGQYSRGGLDT